MSPRPPPKISYKDNWMNELDSEVARSSKDTQRIQPKPKTQLSRRVRPVCGQESTEGGEARTFPSSRACQKDRKSSSSRSTSSRLAAEHRLPTHAATIRRR